MAEFVFQDGQKVVFIGDSITDCDRRGGAAPFGDGYVKVAIDLITARYPERRITFVNQGISGNTVRDLRGRWETDVLAEQPDWLSVKIGINDLHRTLDGSGDAVGPEAYASLYQECLEMVRARSNARLVLIDPFYIARDPEPGTRAAEVLTRLPAYLSTVERLAREFGALHVRTQQAFERQLEYRPGEHFCPEPVHPYLNGHIVIAHELLRALGW